MIMGVWNLHSNVLEFLIHSFEHVTLGFHQDPGIL